MSGRRGQRPEGEVVAYEGGHHPGHGRIVTAYYHYEDWVEEMDFTVTGPPVSDPTIIAAARAWGRKHLDPDFIRITLGTPSSGTVEVH